MRTDCFLNRLIGSRTSSTQDLFLSYTPPEVIALLYTCTSSFSRSIADDARGDMDGGGGGGQSGQHSWCSSVFGYRLNKVISRLCSTHQFKNLQVEMLYQRYFLRMNQNNTTHIVSLLLALVLLLVSIHIFFALFVVSSPSSASDPTYSSLQVLGNPSTSGGDSFGGGDGAAAVVMSWDNGTRPAMVMLSGGGGGGGGGGSVDNSNFSSLSVGENMTATWLTPNDTISAVGSSFPASKLRPTQMTNYYFAPNILALVITLGICGTICIRKCGQTSLTTANYT